MSRKYNPTEIILSDPYYKESLLETISRIKSGKVKWFSYEEVFGEKIREELEW